MDREAGWVTVHVVSKSKAQLSDQHFYFQMLSRATGLEGIGDIWEIITKQIEEDQIRWISTLSQAPKYFARFIYVVFAATMWRCNIPLQKQNSREADSHREDHRSMKAQSQDQGLLNPKVHAHPPY